MFKLDEALFRSVLEYSAANASVRKPVKLKLCWGEIGGLEYSEDDVLLAVRFLALKNCIEVGQNFPRSKLTKEIVAHLETKDVRIYGILAPGLELLYQPFKEKSPSPVFQSLVSSALSFAAEVGGAALTSLVSQSR